MHHLFSSCHCHYHYCRVDCQRIPFYTKLVDPVDEAPPSSPASSSTGVKIPEEDPLDVPAGDEPEEEEVKLAETKVGVTGGNDEEEAWDDDW
jgi:hypothetical protein